MPNLAVLSVMLVMVIIAASEEQQGKGGASSHSREDKHNNNTHIYVVRRGAPLRTGAQGARMRLVARAAVYHQHIYVLVLYTGGRLGPPCPAVTPLLLP